MTEKVELLLSGWLLMLALKRLVDFSLRSEHRAYLSFFLFVDLLISNGPHYNHFAVLRRNRQTMDAIYFKRIYFFFHVNAIRLRESGLVYPAAIATSYDYHRRTNAGTNQRNLELFL